MARECRTREIVGRERVIYRDCEPFTQDPKKKLGIYAPWQCTMKGGDPNLLRELKERWGFSLITLVLEDDDPKDLLYRAYAAGWSNNEIMLSISCNTQDKEIERLIREQINSTERGRGPFYAIYIDEPWKKEDCEKNKLHLADMLRYVNTDHGIVHQNFIVGAYYIATWSQPFITDQYFNNNLSYSDGFFYTRYVRSFVDGDQTPNWEKMKEQFGGYKIVSGWINMSCEPKFQYAVKTDCDKDYLDYYLKRGFDIFDQLWVYAGDICDELKSQIRNVIRYIEDSIKYYRKIIPSFIEPILKTIEPELRAYVLSTLYDISTLNAYLNQDCTRNSGVSYDIACAVFRRRLDMVYDAAFRQGWFIRKCYETHEVEIFTWECAYDDCKRCEEDEFAWYSTGSYWTKKSYKYTERSSGSSHLQSTDYLKPNVITPSISQDNRKDSINDASFVTRPATGNSDIAKDYFMKSFFIKEK